MNFETLFYLLLLLVYVVYQVVASRGAAKKPPPRPQRPRRPERPDAPERPLEEADMAGGPDDEMEEALREIRRALGMEPPAPEPAPPPPPPREEPVPLAPPPVTMPEPKPPAPAVETAAEWASSATASTWGEDAFETAPQPKDDASVLAEVEVTSRPASSPVSRRPALLRRLRSTAGAREAVVLSEILGPPRSLRR